MADLAGDARFWDRSARKYAASQMADPLGYEHSLDRIRHHLRPGDRLLEIGCGTGSTALRLADDVDHILATDLSPEMIAIARQKAAAADGSNIIFQVATPDSGDWPVASVDAVLAMNVLHLIRNRDKVLRTVHEALKPGGLFFSKTPCLNEMNALIRAAVPVMQWIGKAPHVGFLSAGQIEAELRATGFEIVERGRHATKGRDTRPFFVARRIA